MPFILHCVSYWVLISSLSHCHSCHGCCLCTNFSMCVSALPLIPRFHRNCLKLSPMIRVFEPNDEGKPVRTTIWLAPCTVRLSVKRPFSITSSGSISAWCFALMIQLNNQHFSDFSSVLCVRLQICCSVGCFILSLSPTGGTEQNLKI